MQSIIDVVYYSTFIFKKYFDFKTDVLSILTFHKGVSSSNLVDSAVRSHNVLEEQEQEQDQELSQEQDQEQDRDQDLEPSQVHIYHSKHRSAFFHLVEVKPQM